MVCIACTRDLASKRPGHGAPVFTSDLHARQRCCELAGPLRPVTGSPGLLGRSLRLRLLRVLRPTHTASAGNGPSPPTGRLPAGQGAEGWFPRSLCNRSSGEAPGYAPATSPHLRRRLSVWPPCRRHLPVRELPAIGGYALLPSPDPSGFELVDRLERLCYAGSPSLHLPVSLAGPAPSDGAGTSRRCRGCLPPSPAFPSSGCPQLHQPATTGQQRCPFTTARL